MRQLENMLNLEDKVRSHSVFADIIYLTYLSDWTLKWLKIQIWKKVMLSGVSERTVTSFLQIEQILMLELKLEIIIGRYFSGVFFGYPLFYMISFSLEAHETLLHVSTRDVIMLSWVRPFLSLFVPCHPWARERDTQDRLGRGFAPFLLQHKDIFMTSWLKVGRICPTHAELGSSVCAGKADVGNKAPVLHWRCSWVSGDISLFFSLPFFHFVLCLLLCMCWRLGAFQKKYKPLSTESTQPIAQCSTVLAAEPFLYSLCTGQGFFHFMHHP